MRPLTAGNAGETPAVLICPPRHQRHMDDIQLFVLRVWLHQGQFRASVRATSEEEPRLFTEPGQLTEFLVTTIGPQTSHTALTTPGE